MTPSQVCHQICKKSGSNFVYSFYFLGSKKRHALETFYAFCRLVDDAVDLAPNEVEAKKNLEFWKKEVTAVYQGNPANPVSQVLVDIVKTFEIPKIYFEEILNGCEMDLVKKRYETFEELKTYCYRVASCVGLVCIHIFGVDINDKTKETAISLGIALQLTNILRDIAADLGRGRVYLPAEDLNRFGVAVSDLGGSNPDNLNLIDLLYFEIERTRTYFKKAWGLFPKGSKERRKWVAAVIMGKFYEAILNKIAKNPLRVFREKVRLTTGEKIKITLRTLLSLRTPQG